MNQEINKSTLKTALKNLPGQRVREEVWDHIEQGLLLQGSLQTLPTHTPPPMVWEGIEKQLENSSRTIYLLRSIAATLVLLGIGFWWSNTTIDTTATLNYSKVQIDQRLLQVDWEAEEIDQQELETLCQQQQFACTSTLFKNLERELNELESAKQELVNAINIYGKDATLIVQLKDLEIERTTVIREMYQTLL